LLPVWRVSAPSNSELPVWLLLLDGHVVDHALHPVDIGDELGNEVLFGGAPGLAAQRDHAIRGLDLSAGIRKFSNVFDLLM
jgi:hypothetical protein